MDKKYDKKEKINFALKKENTICSLFEVEKFLRSRTIQYIKELILLCK